MATKSITASQLRWQKGGSYILIFLGLALFGFGVTFINDARESASWPVVEGTVQNIAVSRHVGSHAKKRKGVPRTTRYFYSVNYLYTVDGNTHRGQQFSLGDGKRAGDLYEDMATARAAGNAAYPSGSIVLVYYNPENVERAVLSAGANWGSYMPAILGLLFFGFGALLLRLTARLSPVAQEG